MKKKSLLLYTLSSVILTSGIILPFVNNNLQTKNEIIENENKSIFYLNNTKYRIESIDLFTNQKNEKQGVYVDETRLPGHGHETKDRKEIDFTFKTNLDFLNKYFIGKPLAVNNLTNSYYFYKTILNFTSKDDDFFEWESSPGYEKKKFGIFTRLEKDFNLDENSINVTLSNNGEITNLKSSNWLRTNGKDQSRIDVKLDIKTDFNSNKLIINKKIILFAKDVAGSGWTDGKDAYSYISAKDKKININIDIVPPYSLYDLNQFKELFKQVVASPIRLKNVSNPILFEYSNDGTNDESKNEYQLRKIIEERAKQFYSNTNIINKLGPISDINGNQDKNVSHIKLFVDPSTRGKTGTQSVKVRFYLGHDRLPNLISTNSADESKKFYFNLNSDKNSAESFWEETIKIYVQIDPKQDLEIDQLVHIIPFKSASNEIELSHMVQKELKMELGNNDPDPLSINSFKVNINKLKKNGIYESLVEKEKLPVINKVGTVITIELIIEINNHFIRKEVKFERVFNNGKIFTIINLNDSDYENDKFKIANNQIHLGLELNKDEINIYNSQQIKLISKLNENELVNSLGKIKLSINNVLIQVPAEQITSRSKWVQLEDQKIFEKERLKYVGQYKTYDPFLFRLDIQNIPLYDPITGEFIGYASKYKPFIRKGKFNNKTKSNDEDVIFPIPSNENGGYYEANLGTYVMKNKAEAINGNFDFQIVVKEYEEKTQNENIDEKYTKDRWIISISINLLTSKANFVMSGYKDNQLIKEENEKKYFNEDSPEYRGDYVDKETGMYKSKIVWVNSYPPEAFLYDPLDENGKHIVDPELNDENGQISKKAKYDIGYIAELNATGFAKNDYSAITTFGGYETFFDTNLFNPTGLMPYSEFYKYNKNSLIPNIERVPLSQSGLQTVKADHDFRQIVLKRSNSNTFLYQFVKISKSSSEIKKNQDLVSLYGNLIGLKNKPLFIDFWNTYQGKHLMDYLINSIKLIENEEKVRELTYEDVIQYWNIYVNDPSHYNQDLDDNKNNYAYDISKLILKSFEISANSYDSIRRIVIDRITKELSNRIIKQGWLEKEYELKYDKHFKIETNVDEFNNKLKLLLAEYEKPLNEAKFIEFNIFMIEDGFESQILTKPTGKNKIKILNNKDADKIIDLTKETASRLEINTSKPYFSNSNNLTKTIANEIYKSINNDFDSILKKHNLVLNKFPQLNQDYELIFFKKDKLTNLITYQTTYIDKAIQDVLLFETNTNVFYNELSIEIRAKFNNQSHYMKNSLFKSVINNSALEEAIKDTRPFDLSTIKSHEIKINTQANDFPLDNNLPKEEIIFNLLLSRIKNDIEFWARKWIYVNKIDLSYKKDYEIKFIKAFDHDNNPIYYEAGNKFDFLSIINDVLLKNLEQDFNRNLYVEVYATNAANLSSSFIKKINNNYQNKAIENDDLGNFEIDNSTNNSFINEDEIQDLLNKLGQKENINLWWVITPITVLGLIITCAVIVFVVRKNRRIR